MKIEMKNLSQHTGVSINKFDCSKTLNSKQVVFLKSLMQDKHFICFKNQELDENSLIKFLVDSDILNPFDGVEGADSLSVENPSQYVLAMGLCLRAGMEK